MHTWSYTLIFIYRIQCIMAGIVTSNYEIPIKGKEQGKLKQLSQSVDGDKA